jgi:hypothetical protein
MKLSIYKITHSFAFIALFLILMAIPAHAQTASSSQVYVLSQVQPETWVKTLDQKIVTKASGQVDAFLVTSSAATKGYYLGAFPTSAAQTGGDNLVTATNTVSASKTLHIPNGTYYVRIFARQGNSSISTVNTANTAAATAVSIPTSGASATSRSAVTLLAMPYIIVTAPISNESWKTGSVHVATWVSDFKRSDTSNSSYAAVAITLPYGIGPSKTASSSVSSTPAHSGPQNVPSGNQLSVPTPPTPPGLPSLPNLPSLPSLPNLPLGIPSPLSVIGNIFGGIFGSSKPFAVSVNIKAVTYTATSTNHYGKSYVIAATNYLESGQAQILLRVPSGQYVITVGVPLYNSTTRKVETITGTSSLITVQ